ncbi:MAG: MFS transporter [Hyphomicrobiales bacterium]
MASSSERLNDDSTDAALDKRALHNVIVLSCAQMFCYAIAPLSMAVGGLSGSYLLGDDKTLATLPITFFILGPLFSAMPAALFMRRFGRRAGFLLGSAIGMLACGLACLAILQSNFWALCFAHLLIGVSIAFAQQYRFAAADFGSSKARTRGLSWVMAGGLVAAILGPQTALYFMDYFSVIVFAGSYVGGMLLAGIGFVALLFLKAGPNAHFSKDQTVKPSRPLLEIARQPMFITSVVCASTSYMSMSLVMTAAPLAMIICGHTPGDSTNVIQLHVVAMFAPSFFTGSLINRFGHAKIISAAIAVFLLCAIVGLSGIEVSNFTLALIALGIAWNFGYVGGSSLVTKTYEPQERGKVQGLFDSIVFGSAATMSLLSGVLLNWIGWHAVVSVVFPLAAICALVLFVQRQSIAAIEV